MAENKIRVGIIGMGNMGRAHGGNLAQMPQVEIGALCSQNAADAESFATEKGLSCPIFTDAYQMLEQVKLDAVYICLPPYAHDGQLEAAAAKGLHIFAEKPIALNVERARSMAKAVADNNVRTQVGYHMRFGGAVTQLKALMDQGVTGRPTLYTANYECNSLHTPWWIDVTKCGGQVFEQVIHLYDMALYLMGTPATVNGYTANLCHGDTPGYTVEDTSVSAIRFANGALGNITGSNCAVKNEWNGRFRIVFEHLVADFTDFNHATFIHTKDEEKRVEEISCDTNAMYDEDRYFMDVVAGKAPETATIAEGLIGLEMVNAVVQSSQTSGAPINL